MTHNHNWDISPHGCEDCGDDNCLVVCTECGEETRACDD